MGPTTVALLKLYKANTALREAQALLESVTRDVRQQEAKHAQAVTRLTTAQSRFKDLQVKSANHDLDLKMRLEHIEKLRNRQQQAANNKEYQALLVEINTAKVDRAKIEEAAIKLLEQLEGAANDVKNYTTVLQTEEAKLNDMRAKVGDKAVEAQAEVDRLRPDRDAAASGLKPELVLMFDRLAERFEGEAMAAIDRPNPREEEYLCTGCNMGLVPDVFNKLKTRDDVVTCPTCRRILYIPETLTLEAATAKKVRGGGKAKSATASKTVKKVITPKAEETPGSKWAALVSAAQGESARDAAEADHKPVECVVEVNGELVGTFKGKSAEHLERVIRFRLEESKMSADVKVTAVSAPAAAAVTPAAEPVTPAAESVAVVEPATEPAMASAGESAVDAGEPVGAGGTGSEPTVQQ